MLLEVVLDLTDDEEVAERPHKQPRCEETTESEPTRAPGTLVDRLLSRIPRDNITPLPRRSHPMIAAMEWHLLHLQSW